MSLSAQLELIRILRPDLPEDEVQAIPLPAPSALRTLFTAGRLPADVVDLLMAAAESRAGRMLGELKQALTQVYDRVDEAHPWVELGRVDQAAAELRDASAALDKVAAALVAADESWVWPAGARASLLDSLVRLRFTVLELAEQPALGEALRAMAFAEWPEEGAAWVELAALAHRLGMSEELVLAVLRGQPGVWVRWDPIRYRVSRRVPRPVPAPLTVGVAGLRLWPELLESLASSAERWLVGELGAFPVSERISWLRTLLARAWRDSTGPVAVGGGVEFHQVAVPCRSGCGWWGWTARARLGWSWWCAATSSASPGRCTPTRCWPGGPRRRRFRCFRWLVLARPLGRLAGRCGRIWSSRRHGRWTGPAQEN